MSLHLAAGGQLGNQRGQAGLAGAGQADREAHRRAALAHEIVLELDLAFGCDDVCAHRVVAHRHDLQRQAQRLDHACRDLAQARTLT